MSGYIGAAPTPQATQTRQTFTATSGQTTFNTIGYQAGYLSVYLNGIKLVDGTDYTATNGSDVVLTTGAATDDTLEVVAFSTFEVLDQNFAGGVTIDNDGATVLTVDRATSDGTIIDVQKDGSSVGGIGASSGGMYIGSDYGDDAYIWFGNNVIQPVTNTGGGRDNAIDIGTQYSSFKDLYLSGGVYLGGTGSANLLDSYEEGTWTPVIQSDGDPIGYTIGSSAVYIKTGGLVSVGAGVIRSDTTAWTGAIRIAGLPFATAGSDFDGSFWINNASSNHVGGCYIYSPYNGSLLRQDGNSTYMLANNWGNGRGLYFRFTYRTNY